ncbi:MAG: ferrous iron transport protein B [Lactococcus lactis]|nr:ferrous iron transport protein B [Lactococcus lactis]
MQDLPGLYSLSPYSLDEQVARDFLTKTPPDALINIVDSTNLERSLYLTLQLMELGIPMVLALNMSDLLAGQGKKIDIEKLSYSLGIPVVTTSSIKNKGLDEVVKVALKSHESQPLDYDHRLEGALSEIGKVTGFTNRFEQIKVFEGDKLLLAGETDKALSQQVHTDNSQAGLSAEQLAEIEKIVSITEKLMADDRESIIVNERYDLIGHIVQLCVTQTETGKINLTDRIDQIITHKWLGLPIFVFVMWLVYFISIQTVGTAATDWLNDVFFGQWLPDLIANGMNALAVTPWVQDLVLNGVVAGIGAILGFVPQIFVLFLLLGILEDSGYMARVAFVMDRIFRRFGLSGKSFIPMLIASGCGVPGIMATRTIEQERDRKITIMVTTFMPCSAKLPIIALVSGAFFPHASWVAPSAYFLGMSMIILSGIILKKTRMFSGDTSAFIMELPAYHLPYAMTVLKYAFDRAFSFVKRAGTIIFAMNVLIWFTSNYNWTLAHVDASQSILADVGKVVAVIFAPLGFGEWRATVATITGLIAKETIVGTMGVLFAHNSSDSHQLWSAVQATYTPLSAYSLLVFNLLCAPCVAAISTIYKEMGDVRWTLRAVGFQTLVAYSMSFIIYQLGSLFSSQNFDVFSLLALIVLSVGLYFIFRKGKGLTYELS